jgi:hypothetical protein
VVMCRSTVPVAGTSPGGSSASTDAPLLSGDHAQGTVPAEPLLELLRGLLELVELLAPAPPDAAGDADPTTVLLQAASASSSPVVPSAWRALTRRRSSR